MWCDDTTWVVAVEESVVIIITFKKNHVELRNSDEGSDTCGPVMNLKTKLITRECRTDDFRIYYKYKVNPESCQINVFQSRHQMGNAFLTLKEKYRREKN